MIELWIDGSKCDIDRLPTIPIGFDIANLTNAEGARSGRVVELTLPATPTNDTIFGASRDIYATNRFNMEHHTAQIKKDGVLIFEGTTYLLNTTIHEGLVGYYTLRINEGGAEWLDSVIHGLVSDLEIPFSARLNLSTISNSWDKEQSVRFLPIYQGNYLPHYSSSSALPAERVLLTDDYHPFISASDMVRAMFEKSEYKLCSNFLDSEFGRSLYISGEYSHTNDAKAKAECNFFARRAAIGSATADLAGRVYTSTAFATHTIGPIVDTANPEALDENGVQMSDTFNTNNAFSKNSAGNICFTPKISVRAGFLLHLEYSTEYKILSRERLCGFDILEGVNGERIEIKLTNTCQDFRGNTMPNAVYRAIVFDHTEGREYQLSATLTNNTAVAIKNWSSRSTTVTMPATTLATLNLYYRDSSGNGWTLYSGDWALYAGYIEEVGFVDVEVDFRLPHQEISAGESFVLDKFWFGGAQPGMKLFVETGTSLQPYFSDTPGYNASIEFKDIAPRNIRQLDLLKALGEMFNLVFYTDRKCKEVHIEPLEDFYDSSKIIDWSHRINLQSTISISDTGIGLPQDVVLKYVDADKASRRFNNENGTTLGRWSFRNAMYGSKKSTKTYGDSLFTTTLNISNVLYNAPSASLLQTDVDGGESSDTENSSALRIVCYKGLKTLPNGEIWSSAAQLKEYPYAAFVDNEDINLCFEDRYDTEGLHRYYKPMLTRQRDSQNVTMELYLTTAEIASLFTAEGTIPSMRTRFRFHIQGESSLFRLVRIEDWNTDNNCVKCTFERELND